MLSGPGQFAENETNEVKFNQKHTFLNAAFTHMALIPVYVWHVSHFKSEIEICKKKNRQRGAVGISVNFSANAPAAQTQIDMLLYILLNCAPKVGHCHIKRNQKFDKEGQ